MSHMSLFAQNFSARHRQRLAANRTREYVRARGAVGVRGAVGARGVVGARGAVPRSSAADSTRPMRGSASASRFVRKTQSVLDFRNATADVYNQQECPVCLEPMLDAEIINVGYCRHIYHRDCHRPSMHSCPVCRYAGKSLVQPQEQEQEQEQADDHQPPEQQQEQQRVEFGTNVIFRLQGAFIDAAYLMTTQYAQYVIM